MSQIKRKMMQLRQEQVEQVSKTAMVSMWETLLSSPFKTRAKMAWRLLIGKRKKKETK